MAEGKIMENRSIDKEKGDRRKVKVGTNQKGKEKEKQKKN